MTGCSTLVPYLAVLLACSLLSCRDGLSTSEHQVEIVSSAQEQLTLIDEHAVDQKRGIYPFVSITAYAPGEYLLADYAHIFHLALKNAKLRLMKPVGLGSRMSYFPTAVSYSPTQGRLYVANYSAQNLLEFRVMSDTSELVFTREIRTPHTDGPEGVFVSADGRYLASANYDGGTVGLFDLHGDMSKEIWVTHVGTPHGVTIVGASVFATDVAGMSLVELSLENGQVIRKQGGPGWKPLEGNLLHPTSVYPIGADELVVSNAQSGFVSFLDTADLRVTRVLGANGPSHRFLNMPFAAYPHDGNIFVLSTYQQRILVLDQGPLLQVKQDLVMDANTWRNVPDEEALRGALLHKNWNSYRLKRSHELSFGGAQYDIAYGSLVPKSEQKLPTLLMPGPGSRLFDGWNFYFQDVLKFDSGFVVFSPQNRIALFISSGGDLGITSIPLEFDCWRLSDDIWCPGGKFELAADVEAAKSQLGALVHIRRQHGYVKPEDLFDALRVDPRSNTTPHLRLRQVFSSQPGTRFAEQYQGCLAERCEREQLQLIAKDYFKAARTSLALPLEEWALVAMLTGESPAAAPMAVQH